MAWLGLSTDFRRRRHTCNLSSAPREHDVVGPLYIIHAIYPGQSICDVSNYFAQRSEGRKCREVGDSANFGKSESTFAQSMQSKCSLKIIWHVRHVTLSIAGSWLGQIIEVTVARKQVLPKPR